ncbi:hypothetical protein RYX36_035122 [Vicia faba]
MEAARKYSLTVAFLLAFLIIATDMATESQGRGVSENTQQACVNGSDCLNMATESQGRGVSENTQQVCVNGSDCLSKHFPCPPYMIPFCVDGSCKCFHE